MALSPALARLCGPGHELAVVAHAQWLKSRDALFIVRTFLFSLLLSFFLSHTLSPPALSLVFPALALTLETSPGARSEYKPAFFSLLSLSSPSSFHFASLTCSIRQRMAASWRRSPTSALKAWTSRL
jgi:hypothetical protein